MSPLSEPDQILAAVMAYQLRNVKDAALLKVVVVRDADQTLGDPSVELLAHLQALHGDVRASSAVDRREPHPKNALLLDNGPVTQPAADLALVLGCAASPGQHAREYQYTVKKTGGLWVVTDERVTVMT